MFRKQTLFIIGAGANWHYGYPTGDELIQDVRQLALELRDHCQIRLRSRVNLDDRPSFMQSPNGSSLSGVSYLEQPWIELQKNCDDFLNRLENVAPVVIDYFLGWNQHLADLGRILIAGALLKREALGAGRPRQDGTSQPIGKHRWDRYIVHQLLMPVPGEEFDLTKNKVSFITFNYDTSLERNLGRALSSLHSIPTNAAQRFMTADRVLHMYGELCPVVSGLDFGSLREDLYGKDVVSIIRSANILLNSWHEASRGLRVIDPLDKHDDKIAEEARKRLSEAEVIYILGFGFDENNLRRLGFPRVKPLPYQTVFLTNMDDSMSVNSRASNVLRADIRNKSVASGPDCSVQKSVRNVDAAIGLDFGGLAE